AASGASHSTSRTTLRVRRSRRSSARATSSSRTSPLAGRLSTASTSLPDGRYAERNAYDLVVQGETGLISITGTPEEPARVGVSICDVGAGSYAAVATAAALARRARTGEGERVSVSLFDTMVDWLGYFPHQWWHRREVPPRTGMRHPHFCPYGPFPAGDGRLFGFAVLSDEHWRAFALEVIDRPDLLADERLASNESRVEHRG